MMFNQINRQWLAARYCLVIAAAFLPSTAYALTLNACMDRDSIRQALHQEQQVGVAAGDIANSPLGYKSAVIFMNPITLNGYVVAKESSANEPSKRSCVIGVLKHIDLFRDEEPPIAGWLFSYGKNPGFKAFCDRVPSIQCGYENDELFRMKSAGYSAAVLSQGEVSGLNQGLLNLVVLHDKKGNAKIMATNSYNATYSIISMVNFSYSPIGKTISENQEHTKRAWLNESVRDAGMEMTRREWGEFAANIINPTPTRTFMIKSRIKEGKTAARAAELTDMAAGVAFMNCKKRQ